MKFLTNVDFDMKIMYKTKLSLLSYVIALIAFFHLTISSLVAQDMDSREGDSLALVALYNSTNGTNWKDNDNWLTNNPIDLWETSLGSPPIALVDGRVTELFLGFNKLEGPIPPEIGNLTKLKRLFLNENKLNGAIPPELGRLTELKILVLQLNNLTGNIPKELSMLSNLGAMLLAVNNLDGSIPPELGRLDKLASLFLSNNNLSGEIPKELGNISNLQGLYLNGNNLTGSIPVELANPERMQALELYDNNLSGIVRSELGSISNLCCLYLSNNKFSAIEKLDINSDITRVYVDGNRIGFSSIVPNMNGLRIYNNQIVDGRDTLMGTETRSIALTISDDHPDNRYQWYKEGNAVVVDTNRRYVISDLSFADAGKYYASITNTNFPLDTFWRDTIDLEIITLYVADSLALVDLYNSTNGFGWGKKNNWLSVNPIGAWEGVTATNRVDEIDLEGNNLVGVIPSSIGDLDKLRRLDLSNNSLMDSMPLELANLSDLEELRLNNNNLTGIIPLGLGSFENLTQLRLNNNNLTGTIPSELGDLENLAELRLNNNSLTGTIPLKLGSLENLIQLRLNDNRLMGVIPSELGGLTNIENLYLQNNELDSIENISSLPTDAVVDISNNKIGFVSIAPNIGVIDSYASQVLDTKDAIYAILNNELSLTVSDDHPDNSYQWYKEGNVIVDAIDRRYVISDLSFADAGKYYASITNTNFPLDTFWRDTIDLEVITLYAADSMVLVDLYNSTNGFGWKNNNNWLTINPIGTWKGVTVTNRVEIDLEGNNLVGVIPSSIGDLDKLRRLDLSNNNLTGTIPSELGNLENLTQLRLNDNRLMGVIPSELGSLVNIETLYLQNNELNSIEDINSLPIDDNSIVNISNNKIGFVSIVPNIGVIDLYNNQLLDTKDTIYADFNDKFSLIVSDDHPDNSYQWYKDDELIENATGRIYSVEGFGVDDAGEYYATIQNTKAPGATSRRETIYVFINKIS